MNVESKQKVSNEVSARGGQRLQANTSKKEFLCGFCLNKKAQEDAGKQGSRTTWLQNLRKKLVGGLAQAQC